MSTSFTIGRDLILPARLPEAAQVFTSFARGHFVKPGSCVQPVRATARRVARPASFSGGYSEVFVAAPIDLEYDEPNAVTECEVELVQPGNPLHEVVLPEGLVSPRSAA